MSDLDKKVDKLMGLLKGKGYKNTDKRRAMLELLVKEDRYINAKFVLENISYEFPGLSFDTVYRNLNTYEKLHILETTELKGEKYFKIGCIDGENHHHHHHICQNCGRAKVIHIDTCKNLSIPELEGYVIFDHKFEVYGLCPECQSLGVK